MFHILFLLLTGFSFVCNVHVYATMMSTNMQRIMPTTLCKIVQQYSLSLSFSPFFFFVFTALYDIKLFMCYAMLYVAGYWLCCCSTIIAHFVIIIIILQQQQQQCSILNVKHINCIIC